MALEPALLKDQVVRIVLVPPGKAAVRHHAADDVGIAKGADGLTTLPLFKVRGEIHVVAAHGDRLTGAYIFIFSNA
ncbi:MAG: hypothetical protein MPK75_01845 [Alphaproteobacteria bacterium]|nr:hypothetical protein [Alphaproteobacteria bacterium]